MNLGTYRSRWIVAVALGVWLAGCAAREISQPPPQPAHLEHEEYVIGVRDVLRVSVWKNPELSVDVIVRMDGKISVPLLDDVQAEGLTPMELKEVLAREFSEYVASPDVTVIVVRMDSQFVLLMGDGLKANRQVPLTRDLRVLDAVALGGGFSSFADRGDIRIVRRHQDGAEVEYRFDYDAYIKGRAPGTNIVLQNRDTVIVPD
jgi:polysaccharide export outer membrane protein